MKELFLIARTKSDFSGSGFIPIIPFAASADELQKLNKIYIWLFGDYRALTVDAVDILREKIAIKIRNFDKEREIRFLFGKELFIDSSQLADLPVQKKNIDLIGSSVFRNSEFFGLVKDVIVLPSNDVLVVETDSGEEILIPAVKDYVVSINHRNKKVILKPGNDSLFYDEN